MVEPPESTGSGDVGGSVVEAGALVVTGEPIEVSGDAVVPLGVKTPVDAGTSVDGACVGSPPEAHPVMVKRPTEMRTRSLFTD